MDHHIEKAGRDDLARIESMLTAANLPTEGVAPLIESFFVIRDKSGHVAAAAVIEWHEEPARGEPARGEPTRGEPTRGEPARGEPTHESNGLLRSVVVDPEHRGQGLGKNIVRAVMDSTDRDLYLLTESATQFFRGLGFESIDRSLAPPALRQSEEFRCLCGESAAFMRRSVVRTA